MIRSKNILLGSGAAFIHAEREFPRMPKDRDAIYHKDAIPLFMESPVVKTFIMTRPSKYKAKSNFGMFWEVELAEVEDNSSTELWKLYDTLQVVDEYCRIPCLDLLREIKMCHRFKYSPHFEKTRSDILWFRQHTKGIVKDEWKPFLTKRIAEATRKTPRLKGASKEEFFKDTYGDVPQLVHDTIHETMAFDDKPAYSHFSNGPIECCMKTFFACDERIKLNSVFEEAAVLACERVIWPTQFKCDELAAFKSSLQRMCCHITSGKYREYCWENYDNVLKMFVPGLITTKFKKGLDNGKIRRS